MRLTRLRLSNFRNHIHTEIDCPEGIVFLAGENGAGKTSMLEAISLLCMTRSFVTSMDRTLVRTGTDGFLVAGEFAADAGARHLVEIELPAAKQRKTLLLDYAAVQSSAELIGQFPLVTLSPQHRPLVADGPAERRTFIDIVLSQAHHAYLLDLIEYKRVLKHRNALLGDDELSIQRIRDLIEPWTESFAQLAVRISHKRWEFVKEFSPLFFESYRAIAHEMESPHVQYACSAGLDVMESADGVDALRKKLADAFALEVRRGTSMIGPHRDDLNITLNGRDVRAQASQGQVKTILVALKFAEWHYLKERLYETPILLLDDVFSELDAQRLASVLSHVDSIGQTFITSVNESAIDIIPRLTDDYQLVRIVDGSVTESVPPSEMR